MTEAKLYERACIEAGGLPNFDELTVDAQREAIWWLYQQYKSLMAALSKDVRAWMEQVPLAGLRDL